jgi:4-hydroxy-2-oxoheptanedioate aldolase
MLQAESRAAITALDDIASLDGVDCIFIGPSDLSADMGYLGNPFADEVQKVIEDAIKRIRGHGKAVGIYMSEPTYAKRYLDLGANMVAIGSDAAVLAHALKDLKAGYQ